MNVNADPKSTKYFDIRKYPELNHKYTDFFSKDLVTSKGFQSDFWRNKTNFGKVSTEVYKGLLFDEQFDKLQYKREQFQELNPNNEISISHMPKNLNETLLKLIGNTTIWKKYLVMRKEFQKVLELERQSKVTTCIGKPVEQQKTKKLF